MTILLIVIMSLACIIAIASYFVGEIEEWTKNIYVLLTSVFLVLLGILIKLTFSN
jgi:hypothetical protein